VGAECQWLWPTPIGLHRFTHAEAVNPQLLVAFDDGRTAQEAERGEPRGPFFASDDDLLHRVKLPEWEAFISFVVASLVATVRHANHQAWSGQAMDLQVGIEGMWFQCSRDGAFHDIHTHGNCSWSGVYIVQIDEPEQRAAHRVYGETNG
jgi:hypothetical protein